MDGETVKQLTHAQTDESEINGGDMKSLRVASVDVGRDYFYDL